MSWESVCISLTNVGMTAGEEDGNGDDALGVVLVVAVVVVLQKRADSVVRGSEREKEKNKEKKKKSRERTDWFTQCLCL